MKMGRIKIDSSNREQNERHLAANLNCSWTIFYFYFFALLLKQTLDHHKVIVQLLYTFKQILHLNIIQRALVLAGAQTSSPAVEWNDAALKTIDMDGMERRRTFLCRYLLCVIFFFCPVHNSFFFAACNPPSDLFSKH